MIKTNKSTLKQKLIEENKVSNKSNMFYIILLLLIQLFFLMNF